jgi:hypothetical protein
MYKHKAVLVAALWSVSVLAIAGDDGTKAATTDPGVLAAARTFESLDKNGDRQISRTEAGLDKKLSNTFATADVNGDGYVSKDEFMSRPQG